MVAVSGVSALYRDPTSPSPSPLQEANVRMVAVSGVSALYRDGRDNVLALHEFKSRFDARFRELIFDVEEEVAVQAVRRGSGGGERCRRLCVWGALDEGRFRQ